MLWVVGRSKETVEETDGYAAMICSSLCPFFGMSSLLVWSSRPSTAYDTSSFLSYGLWGLGQGIVSGRR